MNLKYIPVIILLLACPAYGTDLSDIYKLAVENDPQISAAEARYMAQKEAVPQAWAGMLPSLNATGTSTSGTSNDNRVTISVPGTSSEQSFTQRSWQAVLTQPLFRMESWFALKRAKNIRAQAAADFAADQQELIIRVADSYFNILESEDRLSAARAERDAVQRQLEQVQQRFDVGLVAITDLLESTAAFDSSTVNVIEAEGGQIITFETLLRLTDQPFNRIISLSAEFPVDYPEPRDEEAWVKAALQGNYRLLAAREGVNSARRNLSIARSGHIPTIDAAATYSHFTTDQFDPIDTNVDDKTVSIQITVPIFSSGATRSRAKEAGYRLEEAQRNFDFTQRSVVENTRNLYSAINTDVARVKARLRGIESSQSALDATETGYEVGTRNIVDVLQAQQRLFQAQFLYASARYQYIKDVLRLKQVAGTLSPDDIHELNTFMDGSKTVSKVRATTK